VVVSEFTKAEVVELVGLPQERIRVVPNGVDVVFAPAPSDNESRGDYVLAVGTLEPRKNLARVVEAASLTGVQLRVVGVRGWGGVDVPGWVGEVPDTELAALYRDARCVVYASLYEGFGLPVLEAMASGTPVVTSQGTAMEEIAGGAAVLVDPLDARSIADGIDKAMTAREHLIERGLARAREFTWESAADALVRLWNELA
jgi:glycosyltransferase involved in cell wall biosynthesis